MPVDRCSGCAIGEMLKIKDVVEKRLMNRLPEEVREPLQEAKRNIGRAFQGLVYHLAGETTGTKTTPSSKKVPVE